MAADDSLGVTTMDSKEDVIVVCATDRGGALVLVPGEPATLRIYDARGRCIDLLSEHRFDAIDDALNEFYKRRAAAHRAKRGI